MPPCGYRPPAIDGMRRFMADNLEYFVALYRPQGLTVAQALAVERGEIARIREGERGGPWSATVVELNARFYDCLQRAAISSWDDVLHAGDAIIGELERDLNSLTSTVLAAE